MSLATTASLLEELRVHGLLSAKQVGELGAALPEDARGLARELLRRGWMTPFQLNQALQGRACELRIDQYLLVERLGEGGMGQVYTARDTRLDRLVALKVIRKEKLDHPNAVRRFQREVRAAAQLDHPNIVRALDAGEANGTWYFAMELVAGTDLARRLRESGPLPILEACEYVRQAALGLEHAHEKGMVHRDIKPHNLMVTPPSGSDGESKFGRVKVLDMGLALIALSDADVAASAMTQQGYVMGTVDYLAPEQAMNAHAVDVRADLYSLGCTLYHLLTGEVPFPGGNTLEKLMAHRLQEPTPVATRRPDVPADIAAIVRRLMAKTPKDRFQTSSELVAVLSTPPPAVVPWDVREYAATVVLAEPVVPESGPPAPRRPPTQHATGRGTIAVEPVLEVEPVRPAAPTVADKKPSTALRHRRRWALALLVLTGSLVLLLSALGRRGAQPPTDRDEGEKPVGARQVQDADAEQAWQVLRAKQGEELRLSLLAFRAAYPQNAHGIEAGAWLARLRSPLYRFDAGRDVRIRGLPKPPPGLVRIFRPEDREGPQPIHSVAIRPDCGEIAAAEDGQVRLWDTAEGRVRRTLAFDGTQVGRLAYSPDGKFLAAGGASGEVRVWNAKREEVAAIKGHTSEVRALAWSPGGDALAVGSRDGHVGLWSVADRFRTLRVLANMASANHVMALAWSPDGRFLAGGSQDTRAYLWRVEKRDQPIKPYDGYRAWVYAVAFTPDGSSLVLGGGGDGDLHQTAIAADHWKLKGRYSGEGEVLAGLALTGDGRWLVTADRKGRIAIRNPGSDQPGLRTAAPTAVNDLTLASDSRHFALAGRDGTVYVFRLPDHP